MANLDLSVDVMYNKLHTATSNAGTPGAMAPPAGNTLSDQSWWQTMVRVQRNFFP